MRGKEYSAAAVGLLNLLLARKELQETRVTAAFGKAEQGLPRIVAASNILEYR
jgi:hypothetical protein